MQIDRLLYPPRRLHTLKHGPITLVYRYTVQLSLIYLGWYCGAWVFGLIGCISLSLSLALPTYFNNNK